MKEEFSKQTSQQKYLSASNKALLKENEKMKKEYEELQQKYNELKASHNQLIIENRQGNGGSFDVWLHANLLNYLAVCTLPFSLLPDMSIFKAVIPVNSCIMTPIV